MDEKNFLAQQFEAADAEPPDPAAVARLHGRLRVARGQRDLFVTPGTTLLGRSGPPEEQGPRTGRDQPRTGPDRPGNRC